MVQAIMSEKMTAEYERMLELIRERLKSSPKIWLEDGHTSQFQLNTEQRHVAVAKEWFNFKGKERGGEDPGLRVYPPSSKNGERYLAIFTGRDIQWEHIDSSRPTSPMYSTEEMIDFFFAWLRTK